MEPIFNSMTESLLCIDIDEPIGRALDIMVSKRIRHLPVLDGSKMVGMLSDRDVQRAIKTEIQDVFAAGVIETSIDPKLVVRDFMSWPVVAVSQTLSLKDATDIMLSKKINAVIVENEKREAVGILTSDDLLRVLSHLLQEKQSISDRIYLAIQKTPLAKLAEVLSNTGI